jgi:hypothetical protein
MLVLGWEPPTFVLITRRLRPNPITHHFQGLCASDAFSPTSVCANTLNDTHQHMWADLMVQTTLSIVIAGDGKRIKKLKSRKNTRLKPTHHTRKPNHRTKTPHTTSCPHPHRPRRWQALMKLRARSFSTFCSTSMLSEDSMSSQHREVPRKWMERCEVWLHLRMSVSTSCSQFCWLEWTKQS